MDVVESAVAAIRAGEPVVMPTDTVYGLVATPYRDEPAWRIYRLKQRPETMPIALMAVDLEMLFECVPELRGGSGLVARALFPGPYTLIFPNPARRYRWLTGRNRRHGRRATGARSPRPPRLVRHCAQGASSTMRTSFSAPVTMPRSRRVGARSSPTCWTCVGKTIRRTRKP